MCKCPGSGIRLAWRSHKPGRALGDVEGVRRPGGEELRVRCGTAGRKPACNHGHTLHKHQEPAGSGDVYTGAQRQTTPRRGWDAAPPPSCRSQCCRRALPQGPGVPEPQHPGVPRRYRVPPATQRRTCPLAGPAAAELWEGWRRAPCAPQGRAGPVAAGSRHPLPSPRSPAPAAITCANTRAAPRDQRAAALHSSSSKIITPRAKKLQIATQSPPPRKGELPEVQHATWGASTGTGKPAKRISKHRSLEIKKRWKRATYRNSLLPEPSWLAGCTSRSPSIAMLPAAPACSHSTELQHPNSSWICSSPPLHSQAPTAPMRAPRVPPRSRRHKSRYFRVGTGQVAAEEMFASP